MNRRALKKKPAEKDRTRPNSRDKLTQTLSVPMTKNSQTARTSEAPEMLFLAELPDQSDYIWLLSFEDTRVALFHNNQAPRTTKEIKPFLLAFPTRLLAFFHQVAKV